MTTPAPLSYTLLSHTLRPSRVIVVIDGGEDWSYWSRRALYRASRVWGGGDFVVIPHQDGRVDPTLLRGCQVYDPDFVVTYDPTVEDLERLRPGWFRISAPDGVLLEGADRERAFDEMRAQQVRSETRERARVEIASVCSVYRVHGSESIASLAEQGSGPFTDVMDIPGAWSGSVLTGPEDWGGLAGAAAALHLGMAQAPVPEAREPELDPATRNRLTELLLDLNPLTVPDGFVWHPTAAVSVDPRDLPSTRERTTEQLTALSRGYGDRAALLVLGDTAEDFALAGLWPRAFGTAYWIPSVLGIDEDKLPEILGETIASVRVTLDQSSTRLVLTSISRSQDDLAAVGVRLDAAKPGFAVWGPDDPAWQGGEPHFEPTPTSPLVAVPGPELPWREPPTRSLAVDDRWDTSLPVPVIVDVTGTTTMAAPLPSPSLAGSPLGTVAGLAWHVDVAWLEGRGVCRRATPGHELLADAGPFPATVARSSRHGTSYQSDRYDFVSARIRPDNQLARPALRDLSLDAWIAATAGQHEMTTKPSAAGLRAARLAAMLGGRAAHVELFGGALLPALRAMRTVGRSTREAYPANDGVRIASGEGVLTFAGIRARVPGLSAPEPTAKQVRAVLDTALRAGVLRRGHVLGCAVCGRTQFQSVDRVGQRWTCLRCDAPNDLDQAAWREPEDEPGWFYDLHPVGREFLDQHGDTVALLSAHLRAHTQARIFDDVEEVVLASDRKPVVELDLVAYADDLLTIAECKSSLDGLSKGTLAVDVAKKSKAAAILRADRLIFATEDPEWPEPLQKRIQTSLEGFPNWSPAGPPEIVLVAGLGTGDAQEQVLRVGVRREGAGHE